MAKRFTFRFDTLLKIRRQREDEHKRIVADRLTEIARVQQEIDGLQRQITDELQAVRDGQSPGTIDMQKIVRHRHWLGRLHKSILDSQARQGYLEGQLVQERAALAEAAKQRRILEKLKEHQLERYRIEQNRQETREADDLTGVRFVFEGVSPASDSAAFSKS